MSKFDQNLARLKSDIVTQGDRVEEMTLRAVESYFDHDRTTAATVIADDEVIDRVDVEIERACIPLLALGETDEHKIRSVLMIVKINNELERIADCAVNISEVVMEADDGDQKPPSTFRVMANSVIGMLREANRALSTSNIELARRVLTYDDTVDQFKREIAIDAERKVAAGQFTVSFAFRLRTVAARLERIADHCTNICEQIIYLETGKVVRHLPAGWTEPAVPDLHTSKKK
jgi:phosphate transport system protein